MLVANYKELGVAMTLALREKHIKHKLGALHPACFDHHLKVFHHEARNPDSRRRRMQRQIAMHLHG